MRIQDKLWLLLNRKPPARWSGYISVFVYGTITLVMFFASLALLSSPKPWIGWCGLVVSVGYATWAFMTDAKDGYVDAIHKHQMERWEARKKRLESK